MGSLAVSMVALIISTRRFSFDRRLAGEKKASEIRGKLLDFQLRLIRHRSEIDAFENTCRDCEYYSAKRFELNREIADLMENGTKCSLEQLTSPVGKNGAITFEPMSAYTEALSKGLDFLSQEYSKYSTDCPKKEPKKQSEPEAAR